MTEDKRKMTVLEKIKRCVSLVWDFQEFYGDEDIEDFCSNELDTYSQYNEILDYFKRITELEQENKVLAQNLEDTEIVNKALEKENAELKKKNLDTQDAVTMQMYTNKANKEIADRQLTKAKEIIKELYEGLDKLYLSGLSAKQIAFIEQLQDKAEQFISEVEK